MTEDFAVLDFAVVHATPERVARAIDAAWADAAAEPAPERNPTDTAKTTGLLGRLMSRKGGFGKSLQIKRLSLHPNSLVPHPPYARSTLRVPKMVESAIRLSAPAAPPAGKVTLIELFEDLEKEARLCKELSRFLPGEEIFFFRYSGSLHPGAHFAFHVYKDGRALRRAASESLAGDHGEAPWNAVDSGIPHPAEADSLPAPEAPAAQIMTPERQGAILAALGIDAESLFSDLADRTDVLVLSTEPGGAPLSELVERTKADLRVPPAFEEAAEAKVPPVPEAEPEPQPDPEPDPDPQDAAPAAPEPVPEPEPIPAAEPAPEPDAPALPPLSPLAADAPLPETPEAWEQEVTSLLLACVEAALPEADRVKWLQSFTAQLETGDIDGALQHASDLIAHVDRPVEDRERTAARLQALYAHLRTASTG